MVMNIFKGKQKSLSEIEEETEKLEGEDRKAGVELSIAQKKVAISELKKRGLTAKHFGDTALGSTWNRIWSWLKTH